MTLGDLCRRVGLRPPGPAELDKREIFGIASLAEAGSEEISFYADPRYAGAFQRTRAAAVLVPADFSERSAVAVIRCNDLRGDVQKIVGIFTPPEIVPPPGIHPAAVVDPGACVHPEASIQPFAVIEEGAKVGRGSVIGANSYIGARAEIGEDCILHPGVFIGSRCKIGCRVILHAGVGIGADGFGFERQDGKPTKVPQTGIVQIEDDVEIGANSTVDRARFGRTHIGEGCKIDNLVQIGHNVGMGPNCIVCAQVGIAGGVRMGARVTLAGKVGVSGHLEIGDDVVVGAMSAVVRDVPAGETMAGRPVMPMRRFKQNYVQLRNIHKLYARVAALESESRPHSPSENKSS